MLRLADFTIESVYSTLSTDGYNVLALITTSQWQTFILLFFLAKDFAGIIAVVEQYEPFTTVSNVDVKFGRIDHDLARSIALTIVRF